MNRRTLGALIALNVALLMTLVVATTPEPAQAQVGGLVQSDYLMVASQIQGRRQQDAIWIIERQTARVAAVFYDSATRRFEVIAGREMLGDLNVR